MKLSTRRIAIVLLALILPHAQCSATPGSTTSSITPKQLALGISLLQRNVSSDNVTLSPYSVHAGLTLARIGALGATGVELDKLLFSAPYSSATLAEYASLNTAVHSSANSATVTLANSVWITDRGSFTAKFLRDTSSGFQAESHTIDFQQSDKARQTINAWVSAKTNALIKDLLPPGMPDPHTTSALVNALYFKGAWDIPFAKGATKDGDFRLSRGGLTKVPMMYQSGSMPYFEDDRWQVARLSYAQGNYSYLVLLPKERQSTAEVAHALSPTLVRQALNSATRSQVKLTMPRHKIRQSHELADALRSLGATLPFSDRADYSGMTPLPVSIHAAIHEAVVHVDESGTEAAAATAIVMTKTSLLFDDEPREMKVDHPFAFAIIHTASQAPLFIGVVGDPRG